MLLRFTVGYGYAPWRVLYWFGGLLALGTLVFDLLYPDSLAARTTASEQPTFNPTLYVLDLLLPVASLRQRDAWIAHGPAVWWSVSFTLVGWLLATVLVAGLAGVFRRD